MHSGKYWRIGGWVSTKVEHQRIGSVICDHDVVRRPLWESTFWGGIV